MREIRGGTSRGEVCATSFKMVLTYPTKALGGTGL
jgi:hypothetical protein